MSGRRARARRRTLLVGAGLLAVTSPAANPAHAQGTGDIAIAGDLEEGTQFVVNIAMSGAAGQNVESGMVAMNIPSGETLAGPTDCIKEVEGPDDRTFFLSGQTVDGLPYYMKIVLPGHDVVSAGAMQAGFARESTTDEDCGALEVAVGPGMGASFAATILAGDTAADSFADAFSAEMGL